MEKIVQLRENEYNTLKKRADMNQAAIDKAMEQEIKKSCNITIELEMNVGRIGTMYSPSNPMSMYRREVTILITLSSHRKSSLMRPVKTCCTHTTLDDRNCGKTLWFQHRAGK